MIRAPLIEANGARIPAIGLGTWPLKADDCRTAVSSALKAGYRHIDTAAMYGNETEVGEGLRDSGIERPDIFVTTKVWHDEIGAGRLQNSAEASLKRLGLESVDLLLIHWPNPAVPLAQSIGALCDVRRRGLARNIGVSNFPTKLLEEAVSLSTEPLICNQVEYHPHLDQSTVLAACRRHGMALVAYCPLGRGTVGGVMAEPVVADIAKRIGRTPAQVVLRWHMQQPGVVAVPKSGSPERIAQNLAVFDFTLSEMDMSAISALARPNGRVVNLAFAPEWDK